MVTSTKKEKEKSKIDEIVEEIITEKLEEKDKNQGERIRKQITKEFTEKLLGEVGPARKVELWVDGKKKDVKGMTHRRFEDILRYVAANVPMILVGPAGSGKTQIAVQCAEVLERTHYSISVNEHTSKTDFLGYMDANGKIVKTNFRKAFEEGGVFIIDEIDCANPNILTIINSALSNGFCPFPDGMIQRHADFLCICTANTFGEGENVHYIGRNVLDAATRDRFTTMFIDYDDKIERALTDEKVYALGMELRRYFKSNNVDCIISTRGLIRLTQLYNIKDYKPTAEDIKNCLNLHTMGVGVNPIISKYTQNENK